MLKFELSRQQNKPIKLLCLGAHCDDIEIGCGGTLLALLEKTLNTQLYWVVLSSDPLREREAMKSAKHFLKHSGSHTMHIEKFRNGYFPFEGKKMKGYFERLKKEVFPDLIFTHYRMDLHQDHRMVSDLTWNTFRDNFILEYEIPKYDGDFGSPNLYVPLEPPICERKVKHIISAFRSQRSKHWFTQDLLRSVMRIRGMECASLYAEGFYCRKMTIDMGG